MLDKERGKEGEAGGIGEGLQRKVKLRQKAGKVIDVEYKINTSLSFSNSFMESNPTTNQGQFGREC